jgi:recombination protein RecR
MGRPHTIDRLIKSLSGLPGIGEKTATRLALFIMNQPKEEALELGRSIIEVREKVHFCSLCFNFTDNDLCSICKDPRRDPHVLCVVESPGDLLSIEKTGHFKGRYHVLHGAIVPIDGIGPDQLKIKELLNRLGSFPCQEVILATNPTTRGTTTALYISDKLKHKDIKITRLAQGIPTGGDIEYIDEMTLRNALDGRREIQ